MYSFIFSIYRKVSTKYYSFIATVKFAMNGVDVGHYLRVSGPINFYTARQSVITIGSHCRINSGFTNNAVGGFRRTGIWVGKSATLKIGNNVGISNSTIVALESIEIEDNVMIGGGTNIYDSDFHAIALEKRRLHDNSSATKVKIKICKDSFIGAHSIILKGVEIGEGSIVGAGSVVVKDIPPGEIWGGNPAKFIKKING